MTGTKQIFLIGFSGSGKSTVGPLLAAKLKGRFVDVDSTVARQAGCSIAEIFRTRGERAFRRLEQSAVEKLTRDSQGRTVIALGGGAFENPAIRKLAFSHGLVVYLSCSTREVYRRLRDQTDRPLLKVAPSVKMSLRNARLHRISQMQKRRRSNYRKADLTISTTRRSSKQTAQLLCKQIRKRDEKGKS